MNTISEKAIERVWNRVNEAAPEDVQALTDRMLAEQPFIGAYLLAIEEMLMSPEERGELLLIGLILWEVMSSGRKPLRQVTQEEIEGAEERNVKFLEQLDSGSEMDYVDSLQRLLATYNQAPLLGAVVEALMGEHADNPDAAPDSLGMALLHLKTVLDCLDAL